MNPFPAPDEPGVRPLLRRGVQQSRKPGEGDDDGPAVIQLNVQRLVADLDRDRRGVRISMAERIMPCLHQHFPVVFHQCCEHSNLVRLEPAAFREPKRIQLKFGDAVVALIVNMGRLAAIGRLEEKAIGANAKNGGHAYFSSAAVSCSILGIHFVRPASSRFV
jgi:hypothetical protein